MKIKSHPLLKEVFLVVNISKWDNIKQVSGDMKPYFIVEINSQ